MKGKKAVIWALMALVSVKIFPQSMTLDEAVKTTATELGRRISGNRMAEPGFSDLSIERTPAEIRQQLAAQTKIAVLNFSSNWPELSAYVIDELNNAIVRNGSLTVVDRQQLDVVRKEQNFQLSGDVDDKSAQNIGKFVGAQSVLSGSFTIIGNTNRFRIRVITVETGIVQYSNSIDIKKDSILTALMPKAQRTPKPAPQSSGPSVFDGYTFFNGLTIFGYTYSYGLPLGFSLGAFGVYTSFGFALPDWGNYKKVSSSSSSSYSDPPLPTMFNSFPVVDKKYEMVDWVFGYNVTIIPDILYVPVGLGMETTKEWRLQRLYWYGTLQDTPEWNPAPQWETSFLFETGLLFRVKTPTNFAPYLAGTYRNIGIKKHNFSIGIGGCFDFLLHK